MTYWTEEKNEQLRLLHKKGLSARQMADALGGVSRNAVIGRSNRMGLGPIGGGKASAPVRFQAPKQPKVYRPSAGKFTPRDPNDNKVVNILANVEVRKNPPPEVVVRERVFVPVEKRDPVPFGSPGCRWPVSGEGADMMCCGANRVEPTQERPSPSYCAEHAAIAYQKPKAGAPKNAREMFRALRRYAA